MKIAGYILIFIGTLSFLGASSKGNSVFGPCFFLALGLFLFYRSRRTKPQKSLSSHSNIPSHISNFQKEPILIDPKQDLSETNKPTTQQKEAAICLVVFYSGFSNNPDITFPIISQTAYFFGITDIQKNLPSILSKYKDADSIIEKVLAIQDKTTKEFLLLSCYDLVKLSGNDVAYNTLYNMANEMGYNKTELLKLVNDYS